MAKNDWAIVVGIMNYADPNLAGKIAQQQMSRLTKRVRDRVLRRD